jgi:Ca-activated chloride channel family protein
MRFAHPEIRLFLLFIPLLFVLFLFVRAGRRRARASLGDERLLDGLRGASPAAWVVFRRGALLLALAFLTLAAARPQSALDWINVKQSGIDLVVALDVSESMLAEDVKPNRLARARQDVKDLLTRLQGDRVALVVFSGEALVQSPLTVDYGAVRLLLDVAEPGIVARPGTAIGAALEKALDCMPVEEGAGAQAILLITDGESHEGDVDEVIARAKATGTRVYALGLGRTEGEPIPVRDEHGGVSYKSDREGHVVMSRLDETLLQRIALETGGAYVPISSGTPGVDYVARLFEDLEEKSFEAGMYKLYDDRFIVFLIPAIVLLVAELLLGDWSRRRS